MTPHPGWGDPRQSRLTQDEQRTQFTLWAIARSPLILGGNLTKMDGFTRSLITNKAVIAVNQAAAESHPVSHLPAGFETCRVWVATAIVVGKPKTYVALFNLAGVPVMVHATWEELGVPSKANKARDLWTGKPLPLLIVVDGDLRDFELTLPAHGSRIYEVDSLESAP